MVINTIEIGPSVQHNNMIMFRKYNSEIGFKSRFVVNEVEGVQVLDWANNIIVPYIEFFKNSNGDIVEELTKYKTYHVINVDEELYTTGDDIPEGKQVGDVKVEYWPAANTWFAGLARTPNTPEWQAAFIAGFTGIMDSIEYTIGALPIGIPSGYRLKSRP